MDFGIAHKSRNKVCMKLTSWVAQGLACSLHNLNFAISILRKILKKLYEGLTLDPVVGGH